MTKFFPPLSFLAGTAAWVLVAMTAMHLLSGNFAERECQTACVQGIFYGAVATAIIGVILGFIGIIKSGLTFFNTIAVLAPLSVIGLAGFLFLAGNM